MADQNGGEEKKQNEEKPWEKPTAYYRETPRGFNYGGLFLAIIFIAVGVIYLLNATGWYSINFSLHWNLVWPLILIFIGLSIISRRGWSSALAGFLITVGILGFVAMIIIGAFTYRLPLINRPIEIKKEANVNSAIINLKTGVVKLELSDLSINLIDANLQSNLFKLSSESRVEGNIQKITISTKAIWPFRTGGSKNILNLTINPDIPVKVNFQTGAAKLNLDFSNIKLEAAKIETGASSVNLILGNKLPNSKVEIRAGASSINILLPKDAGAKLILESGLISKNFAGFIEAEPNIYKTSNYDSASNKIDLNLSLGASSLNVGWR